MFIPQVCVTCNFDLGSISIIYQYEVMKLIKTEKDSDSNTLKDAIDKSEIYEKLHIKCLCCRKTLSTSMVFPL